jgi:hypothetical protein
MKKVALLGFAGVVVSSMVFGLNARTAQSRQQYKAAFAAKYTKPDSTDPADKAFADLVKATNCVVCHEAPGNNKKLRNQYGKQLALLFVPPNEKDKMKIDEALDKVAEMHIDEKDPKSPTFGELIKKGKLPGGDPKPAEEKK